MKLSTRIVASTLIPLFFLAFCIVVGETVVWAAARLADLLGGRLTFLLTFWCGGFMTIFFVTGLD